MLGMRSRSGRTAFKRKEYTGTRKQPFYSSAGSVRPITPRTSSHNLDPRGSRITVKWAGSIRDLQDKPHLNLINGEDDVTALKEHFGNDPELKDFEGFFANTESGEYREVYGYNGSTPDLYKDIYKIDPEAHTAGAKTAAIVWYVVTDVFTLTLTELIWTPIEMAAKDKLITYLVTYGPDGKLHALETIH